MNPFLWLIGREQADNLSNSEADTVIISEDNKKSDIVLMDRKPKKYNYRPQNLDEYIGQQKAKIKTRLNIEKILNYKPVHFIISGSAGTGKTTLAYVIANHLNAKVHYTVAGSFNIDTLKKFLEDNEKSEQLNILFVDEIHSINKDLAELLYPLLEDFQMPFMKEQNVSKAFDFTIDHDTGKVIINKDIAEKTTESKIDTVKPFIFIGATTDKDELYRKVAPMIDRCNTIDLEDYTLEDLKIILKQYSKQVFDKVLDNDIYLELAKNCKYTPRIALSLLDDYIVAKDIKIVLSANRIVKEGLTEIDLKILERLTETEKPIGEQALSMGIGLAKKQYITLYEPFLLKQNYIIRTSRGRILSEKGKDFLKSVKNNEK